MTDPTAARPAEVAICEIVPRPGATPERLKALGRAIAQWQNRSAVGAAFFDPEFEGVNDLLHGELPKPLALRTATALRKAGLPGQRSAPRVSDFADAVGNSRTVIVVLWLCQPHHLRSVVADVLAGLPADALADVRIDGQPWQVPV